MIYNAIQNSIKKEKKLLDKAELVIGINPINKLKLEQKKDSLDVGHMTIQIDFTTGKMCVYNVEVIASPSFDQNEVHVFKKIHKQQ